MTLREIMKYIESEYIIINDTPCEVCGGSFMVEELALDVIDDIPYNICSCFCEHCGNEKTFEFLAPFVAEKCAKKIRKKMN